MATRAVRRHWRKDPRLRFAIAYNQHLHRSSRPDAALDSHLERLQQRWFQIQKTGRLLAISRERNWQFAARYLRRRLDDQLFEFRRAAETTQSVLVEPLAVAGPGVALVYADLLALSAEFDNVEILPDRVSVQAEPIVLQGRLLGRFEMTLHLEAFSYAHPLNALTVTALDPHPAEASASTVHPHVQQDSICLGGATDAVTYSLTEGRLLDAFLLIDRVLHTYNRENAYVALEEWDNSPCDQCGRTAKESERTFCSECRQLLCDHCAHFCEHCDTAMCRACRMLHDGHPFCPACYDELPNDEETPDDPHKTEAHPAPGTGG